MKKFPPVIFTFLFIFLHNLPGAFSQTDSASGVEGEEAKTQTKITADIDPATEYLAKSGNSVDAVAWSHSGEYFASSWNNTTILFEAETNNIASIYSNSADNTINPFTDILKISFAPDDSTLLSIHNNNTAMIHSIGDSGSALITGTGERIADAVYTGTSFRLIIPLDEQNLYDCTRQSGTGGFNLEKRLELGKKIAALASSGADGKIFVTFDDGSVNLIDTRTWQITGDMQTYTQTEIYPAFAEDGIHFLSAQDDNRIFISSIADTSEKHTVEEPDGFVYDAIFTPDGNSIIAATKSGYVRIYSIESGSVQYEFRLVDLDTAKTLAASPDGEFVLIGTEMGYIYRWSLHGYEYNQESKRYEDENGEEYRPDYTENLRRPADSLNIMAGYSTMPKYYYGTFGIEANYRNYALYPLYWGTGLSAGAAPPNGDFPYTYRYKGEVLNDPWAYSGMWLLSGGIAYYNPKIKIILFSEIGAGIAIRFMHNNEISASYRGKIYPSLAAQVTLGIQYDWLRVDGGILYDTNLGVIWKGSAGYSVRLGGRKKHAESQNKATISAEDKSSSGPAPESEAEDL